MARGLFFAQNRIWRRAKMASVSTQIMESVGPCTLVLPGRDPSKPCRHDCTSACTGPSLLHLTVCLPPSKLSPVAHDSFLLYGPEALRAGDGRHVYGASHPPRARRPSLERGGRFDQEDREVEAVLQRQELVRDGHREAREHLLPE